MCLIEDTKQGGFKGSLMYIADCSYFLLNFNIYFDFDIGRQSAGAWGLMPSVNLMLFMIDNTIFKSQAAL